jgi:rhamnosyl/mannosyltransferase
MRILQVNKLYYPWIGGVETVARDIAEHFNAKEGDSVINLVCQPRGKRKLDVVNGVQTYRAGSWGIISGMPISFDFFRLFRRLAKETDVIILHHPFPLAFVAYWLFGGEKKVVVWYHSDIVKQKIAKIPFLPFINFVLRRAKCIFVSNKAIIKTSSAIAPFAEKCRVAYFGVDQKRFQKTGAEERQEREIRVKYGTPLVLSVGRLVYYKGYSYLVDAMKEVSARLLIIGNGPLKQAIEEQVIKNGLQEKVTIIDPVEDLVPYYYACDIFALPSCEPSEVFGIVQIEAMACGKPVVNTLLATGVPEVSIDGRTGRTVLPKDAHLFAAALNEILGNREEYKNFSNNAIAEVAARFTKETFFASMDVIEDV